MKHIQIWSDFACPFCWIGEKRLNDAIKELGVENEVKITYRAFELNPNAPIKPQGETQELMARKYGLTADEAKKRIEAIEKMAKDINIDMKFGKVKHTSTFDAHRLMKFAETNYEQSVVDALNFSLFFAYFTKNESLADRKLLLSLAEDAGLDATQANEVLNSDLYARDVRYDEQEAAERGVRGVPYFVFDGEFAVPGAVSTDDFKTALRDMLGKVKEKPDFKAPTCDEFGCNVN